jgi:hypothetical protein
MPRFALFALLALAGCAIDATSPPLPPPAAVTNGTTLDEKLALGVEATYQAARTIVEAGVDSGVIHGATAAKVAQLDNDAYRAVLATRAAYDAGNAASYAAAAASATAAISQLLAITKGDAQ